MAIGFGALPGTSIEEAGAAAGARFADHDGGGHAAFHHQSALGDPARPFRLLRGAAGDAETFESRLALNRLTDALSGAFLVALRITSPFIVYAVIVNFSIGLTNKLTPQIPVYFISLPFVLFGGLILLYFIAPELLHLFIDGFADLACDRLA